MFIRSLIRALVTCVPLVCCASLLAAQTFVLDDFTGPDGTPADPLKWIHTYDCSQGAPQALIQGNKLAQSSTIQSSCAAGCSGNTLLTVAQGSNAKLSVRYGGATSTSPNYQGGYASVALWGTSLLPPSLGCSGSPVFPPMAVIEMTIDGAGKTYVWRIRTAYLDLFYPSPAPQVHPGDMLWIDAKPGSTIEFKLNNVVLHQLPTWSAPPAAKFVAILGSQPQPTAIGTNQTVKWDDFSLSFDFGPCSPSSTGTLTASTCAVSASLGGVVDFLFHPTPGYTSERYLIAGSATGTAPGVSLNGLLIPLNPDSYTLLILNGATHPPFAGFGGWLVAGKASAKLSVPPLVLAPLIGTQFHHAGLVLNFLPFVGGPGTLLHVSNALPLAVIP